MNINTNSWDGKKNVWHIEDKREANKWVATELMNKYGGCIAYKCKSVELQEDVQHIWSGEDDGDSIVTYITCDKVQIKAGVRIKIDGEVVQTYKKLSYSTITGLLRKLDKIYSEWI